MLVYNKIKNKGTIATIDCLQGIVICTCPCQCHTMKIINLVFYYRCIYCRTVNRINSQYKSKQTVATISAGVCMSICACCCFVEAVKSVTLALTDGCLYSIIIRRVNDKIKNNDTVRSMDCLQTLIIRAGYIRIKAVFGVSLICTNLCVKFRAYMLVYNKIKNKDTIATIDGLQGIVIHALFSQCHTMKIINLIFYYRCIYCRTVNRINSQYKSKQTVATISAGVCMSICACCCFVEAVKSVTLALTDGCLYSIIIRRVNDKIKNNDTVRSMDCLQTLIIRAGAVGIKAILGISLSLTYIGIEIRPRIHVYKQMKHYGTIATMHAFQCTTIYAGSSKSSAKKIIMPVFSDCIVNMRVVLLPNLQLQSCDTVATKSAA